MTDGGGELRERHGRAEGENLAREGTKLDGQGMEVGMVTGVTIPIHAECWGIQGKGRENQDAWGRGSVTKVTAGIEKS